MPVSTLRRESHHDQPDFPVIEHKVRTAANGARHLSPLTGRTDGLNGDDY
jgi:hypothetical protein